MIAADDNRCFQFAGSDHGIECEAQAMPLAQSDPADTCRQTLEVDAFARRIQPAVQMRIIRNQLFYFCVGAEDILGVTRQRRPAKRPDAATKQRPHVGRYESRKIECIADALIQGFLANVVAVVEGRDTRSVKLEHGLNVHGH